MFVFLIKSVYLHRPKRSFSQEGFAHVRGIRNIKAAVGSSVVKPLSVRRKKIIEYCCDDSKAVEMVEAIKVGVVLE
jgi:hypothetical protein